MKNRVKASGHVLTEKTAASARPRGGDNGKPKGYDIHDRGKSGVPGLLLRVNPGGSKAFTVQLGRGKRVVLEPAYPQMTIEEARSKARALLGKQASGTDVAAEVRQTKLTLGKFIDGDWSDYAESHIASHEIMRGCVKHSFAELLNKPMAEITELDLARWRKGRNTRTNKDGTLRKPVNLETIRREVTYLRAILNFAVSTKVIAAHQLAHYKVAGTLTDTHGKSKVRFLTPAEEKALREQLDAREQRIRDERQSANQWRRKRRQALYPDIPQDHYVDHIKPLVLLALNTGLRRGDLFDLKWQHVDLERAQIRKVISKSSHARRKRGKPVEPVTLPLAPEAHKILARLYEQRDPAVAFVFPSPVSGARLDNIKRAFGEVLKSARIADFTFHDLRHSFASKLVMAGVDLNTTRELMTHSDIRMTLIYAHLSPDHKAAALARAFGGAK